MTRRVHLLATPQVQVTADFYLDVFNGFTRRFAELLTDLGWEVLLYVSGDRTDAPCTQLISCLSEQERLDFVGDRDYQKVPYEVTEPLYVTFNARASAGIQERKRPGDVLATITGTASLPVAQQHPELTFLEYSIGYRGVCAPYRVYQSHAWRHVVHGYTGCQFGRTTDDVIYHWFHEDEFPVRPVEDYVLYVGRLVGVKGLKTVCAAADAAKVKLYVIGEGDPNLITYGEYIGHMPPSERNRWMAGARALLAPTEYIEPSACVATEAQLCGTPVISTNWGGFTEYIEDGKSGFRCTSLDEFTRAIGAVDALDRDYIRCRARSLYGWQAGRAAYAQYFGRLDAQQAASVSAPADLFQKV